MFVIFPADKLILMTYGSAIPPISPRPTLDCLPEPKVPIVYPRNSKTTNSSQNQILQNHKIHSCYQLKGEPILKRFDALDFSETLAYTNTNLNDSYSYNNTLPPIPPRKNSSASIKSGTFEISCQQTNLILRQLQQQQQQQQQQQTIQPSNPANFEYTVVVGGNMTPSRDYYSSSLDRRRSRSPSIFLEPPSPTQITDPTQPILGPGWGRPMSPMDLPLEPSKSPTNSRSRLRPKLHLPLSRLGRSTSSDHKESNRLREDLQLHVENPIFNSENLRQRNFDAFFESGEPVYKLHPKTPVSAPADASSMGSYSPPALEKYAGVYNSFLRGPGEPSVGGLFTRSPHEKQALNMRSKNVDGYDSTGDTCTASVSGDGGVPQKGDRCSKK